jgi:hypothetical protein
MTTSLFANLDVMPCRSCGKPTKQFPDDDWDAHDQVCDRCVELWLKGVGFRWPEFAPRGGAGKMGTYVRDRYLRDLIDNLNNALHKVDRIGDCETAHPIEWAIKEAIIALDDLRLEETQWLCRGHLQRGAR